MCYTIVFSTTSDEDFSKVLSPYLRLGAPECDEDEAVAKYLSFPHRWVLLSRFGGCSCHFRHDLNDLGFGLTEEWMDEDPDDVEATRHVYDLLYRIVAEGHYLDTLDLWEDREAGIQNIVVELDKVPRDHFRLPEGVRMVLRLSSSLAAA